MLKPLRAAAQIIASALLAGLAGTSSAQAPEHYPARPVRFIVPFGVGGPADIYARLLAQGLSERLGQAFVVENRPGAGSVTGTDAAAKAAADGYTLVMISNTQTINETLYPHRPYRLLHDFAPVTQVNTMPNLLLVNPALAVHSVKELVSLAQSRPGALNYASSGSGTPYHLAAELFKTISKIDIVHVPYRASGDARTALIANQVQIMFDSLPTALPQVQAGKVRALATTGTQRAALLPDLPTMQEAGVAGYEADLWLGVLVPAGTPADIIAQLHTASAAYLQAAATRRSFAAQGSEPVGSRPAEFGRFLAKDVEKWGRVVRFSGASVD
jgi:tripartite-type tricarboxylate transporter receptor subunit TctC